MSEPKTRVITFKASYWSFEETDDHEMYIHIGGKDKKSRSVHLRVEGFTPFGYLQLPKRIRWNTAKCKAVFNYFQQRMKSEGPIRFNTFVKYLLYGKKKINTMFMSFPTSGALRKFANVCKRNRSIHIPSVGNFSAGELIVHEANIDPILKFAAVRKLKLASWMTVKETIKKDDEEFNVEDRKFTTADIDLYADWTNVKPVVGDELEKYSNVIIKNKFCSFDIEQNSENHNSKFPDPMILENCIFQISMQFGRFNSSKKIKRFLLTLYDPLPIEGVTIIRCESEAALLLMFRTMVNKHNPDIFIHYNGMKYDWDCMIKRSELLGIYLKFAMMSRIVGERAKLVEQKWSSSAYGTQVFSYFNCAGRLNIDVLIEIERNFRLPKYSLGYTSTYFLGETKDPITARQLFMLFRLTKEMYPKVKDPDVLLSDHELKICKKRIVEIFPLRQTHGIVRKYRRHILRCEPGEFRDLVRKALHLTGKYCDQDTYLPVRLCDKLNIWATMESFSNCMNVPASYLNTRGQQIRVLAQVYRETLFNNMVIPPSVKTDEQYQGAVVIEAHPGYYELVLTFDFASLYPTVMIAYNICYTTILEDDDPTPDEECHVLDWEDHRGCLASGTSVSLPHQNINIEDLEEYDGNVYAWDEKTRGLVEAKQRHHYIQGVKECVKITLCDGTELDCTPDHRIMTSNNEWTEAQYLEIGKDKVQVGVVYPTNSFDEDQEKCKGWSLKVGRVEYTCETNKECQKSLKFARLLGLVLSDGAISDSNRCQLWVGHELDVKSVSDDIEYICGDRPKAHFSNCTWKIHVPRTVVDDLHTIEGVMSKKRSRQKYTLPAFLLEDDCPLPIIREFLGGLFGGDGHSPVYSKAANALTPIGISMNVESCYSDSIIQFMNNIGKMLNKFDIGYSLGGLRNGRSNHYDSKEQYLYIPTNDMVTFYDKVGFRHCVHKSTRLMAACSYYKFRNKVIEQNDMVVEYVRKVKEGGVTISNATNMAHTVLKYEQPIYNEYYSLPSSSMITDRMRPRLKTKTRMFNKKYFPSIAEYLKMIGAYELFVSENRHTYSVPRGQSYLPTITIPLIDRRNIGKRMTYDLNIKKHHSFLANGIVVHNCEHDTTVRKSKVKKEKILCGPKHYRFRKEKLRFGKDGELIVENEGLMPRLERNLLTERGGVKKLLAKAQARMDMHRGKASKSDIQFYKKKGWEIIKANSLGKNEVFMLDVTIKTLDAEQKGLKVSANSAYGAMGAKNGFMPFIPGAACVTAMGRRLIMMAIDYIRDNYPAARLVYGDTDSCMLYFEGCDLDASYAMADPVSKAATHYLKCHILGVDDDACVDVKGAGEIRIDEVDPEKDFEGMSVKDKLLVLAYIRIPIDLEFENMYGKFFLLTKKRYKAYRLNRKGEIIGKTDKGTVIVRRDNSRYLRDGYSVFSEGVMEKSSEKEIHYLLYDHVQKLFTRQIPDTHLIIYTGISDVISYAKKTKIELHGEETVVYLDENKEPIDDPEGPLDPRLVYNNYPQALLSLKMLRRGEEIPSNTRLEYLYLDIPDAEHQGEKAEDYTFYRENKDIFNFKPDYLFYIEKQLTNPVSELLRVKFPHPVIPYEKDEDAFERLIKTLDDLQRTRVYKLSRYTREIICDDGEIISYPQRAKMLSKLYFILDSAAKAAKGKRNEISEEEYPELVEVCRRLKARHILDKIYSDHGMKKRPAKRPTCTGAKLRKNTNIIFTRSILKKRDGNGKREFYAKKGDMGTAYDPELVSGKGTKAIYKYTVRLEDGRILENVQRADITTYRVKDDTILKDILVARTAYKNVVAHLSKIFSPIRFVK